MRSMQIALMSALMLLAHQFSYAEKYNCGEQLSLGLQQQAEARTLLEKINSMFPPNDAFDELRTFGPIDKLIQERKLVWAAMKAEAQTLIERVNSVRNRWYFAEDVCKSLKDKSGAGHARKQIQFNALPGVGLEAKAKKLLEQVTCAEAAEGVEIIAESVRQVWEMHGVSPLIYDIAVKYGLDQPEQTAKAIKNACPGNPNIDTIATRLPGIKQIILYPYYLFVVHPLDKIKAGDLELYKTEFVDFIVLEASAGRTNSVRNLLEKGQYKMPLDARYSVDGTTLLMGIAMSGNVKLMSKVTDFSRSNPGRGSLAANAQDNEGRTALHYCVLSDKCQADMLRILLVDFKADKSIKFKGQTALELARANKRDDLASILE